MKARELTNSKQFISYVLGIALLLTLIAALILSFVLGDITKNSTKTGEIIFGLVGGIVGLAITYASIKLAFRKYILKKEDVNKAILMLGILFFLLYAFLFLNQFLTFKYLHQGSNDYTSSIINLVFGILTVIYARILMIKYSE